MISPQQFSSQPRDQINIDVSCHKTSSPSHFIWLYCEPAASLREAVPCEWRAPAGSLLVLQCRSSGLQLATHATSYTVHGEISCKCLTLFLLSCTYQGTFHTAKTTTKIPSAETRGTYQLGALRKGVEFIQATLASICELCHRGILKGERVKTKRHQT